MKKQSNNKTQRTMDKWLNGCMAVKNHITIQSYNHFLITVIFYFIGVIGFSQNNIIVLSGANIILDGGTPATNIYMVVDQNSPLGIVRTSGHISSEGQYNFVKWNAGTTMGNYVFPFGVGGNAADYIPFTFNKTTASSADISISTWTTNPQNIPHPAASNVAAVSNMLGIADSVRNAIDRFWDIQTSASVTADLTFSYRSSENTTALPTDTFKTHHWNGATWDPQAGPGNPGVTSGIGTVGPIPGQTTFSPWVLTRIALSATIISSQTGCAVNNGTATANPGNGTAPYTYSWSNGQTIQIATGLGAGNYTVNITDANGSTATATATVTTAPGPTATATATVISIAPGDNTQLTATGGGTYSWSPATGLSCIICYNPTATPSTTTDYCVFVTDANGCTDSACITINVEIPCDEIFIPSAFSPNNDEHNELECVRGNCIQTIYFVIYNRWGEKVFETSDQKICWDGMYKGKLLNTAVFIYYMEASLTSGEKINRKGNVSLVK